ncbi:MAG: hypothetical protein ACKVRN_04235 [Pyrinomonadaceae bacterium]
MFTTFSQLAGRRATSNEISAAVASLDKKSTFFFLSMINNFLALFPESDKDNFTYVQGFLAANLLNPFWRERVSEVTKDDFYSKPVFLRTQLLLFMKSILLEGKEEGGLDPSTDATTRHIVGEICLKFSDFVVSEEQEKSFESSNPLDDLESRRILSELYAQMLPVLELANPPDFYESLSRTLNFIELFDEHYSTSFENTSLSSVFETYAGISFERFLLMTLGIYGVLTTHKLQDFMSNPTNFNFSLSGHFAALNFSSKEIDAFFKLTSNSVDGIISDLTNSPLKSKLLQQHDFTVFRKTPIFHVSHDILTFIDVSFLVEKVSIGFFHTILNVFIEAGLNRQPFLNNWGYVNEIYVNGIFHQIYPTEHARFHPNVYFDIKQEVEAFDGIVTYQNSLLAMQYKGGLLHAIAKYGGDANTLLKEMDARFGRGKKGAITQLTRSIESLFHESEKNRLNIKNVEVREVTRIFPILVANDDLLNIGLSHWILKGWFDEKLKEKSISASVDVKSLLVMTVSDLEQIAPYLEAEDFTFLDFVEFYSRLEYIRFPPPEHWYEPMTAFAEVLTRFRKERNVKRRSNERINQRTDDFFETLRSAFK